MDPEVNAQISQQTSDQGPLPGLKDCCKKPYYDGKDHNLKEKPYCFACNDETAAVSALKRCSRCHVAWYCGTECQKKHFKYHHTLCKQIANEIQCVEHEAVPLRNFVAPREENAVAENLFVTRAGDFGGYDETQAYLQARTNLANSYWEAAYGSEVKEVWEKSLFHYLELLRLDASYRCEVRYRVPFTLLYLNRDDDAYAFIRYWLNFDSQAYDEVVARHGRSREGDWLYPIEPNCRYLDIFEECPKTEKTEPYVVALAIIKMRVIASHDAISQSVDLTFNQTDAKLIQEVQLRAQEMLVDCDLDMASQREQLERLVFKIHYFLFNSMESFGESSLSYTFSKMEEVARSLPSPMNIALVIGLRCFFRVPGAADVLQSRRRNTRMTYRCSH